MNNWTLRCAYQIVKRPRIIGRGQEESRDTDDHRLTANGQVYMASKDLCVVCCAWHWMRTIAMPPQELQPLTSLPHQSLIFMRNKYFRKGHFESQQADTGSKELEIRNWDSEIAKITKIDFRLEIEGHAMSCSPRKRELLHLDALVAFRHTVYLHRHGLDKLLRLSHRSAARHTVSVFDSRCRGR